MKKPLLAALAVILLFPLSACGTVENAEQQGRTQTPGESREPENVPAPGAGTAGCRDGTYDGTGDEWEHGNEDATVVILDGVIKSIVLRRLDTDGNEVDYNSFAGQDVDGMVYPNLKEYRFDLAEAMLEKQTYKVNVISGATISSENWKLAVERALNKAKQ
mgnify:CR=1 FL=1